MKLPEPYTFFVDRALGGKVIVGALREAGMQVEAGDAHFAQDAPDTEWLPVFGQRRWVLLTKDKAIRSNTLERNALVSNQVAAFMLGGGNLPGTEMARIFARPTTLRGAVHGLHLEELRRERALGRRRLVQDPQSSEIDGKITRSA